MAFYNASGYRDPVMAGVIERERQQRDAVDPKQIQAERERERAMRCMETMKEVARLAGFQVACSIMIRGRKSRTDYVL